MSSHEVAAPDQVLSAAPDQSESGEDSESSCGEGDDEDRRLFELALMESPRKCLLIEDRRLFELALLESPRKSSPLIEVGSSPFFVPRENVHVLGPSMPAAP